ncbi:hypothetical protein [Sporosarcina limicola]|uniref:Uncharacterized protein n=1 Tax=Sporosarcina limicola TaxID=34101 RepID=A0A927R594_9BACL|nr:hypothetical protein [Sporosarcina limicola]MBE1553679.1 hypothetical protein [Sporosarcina limicola]
MTKRNFVVRVTAIHVITYILCGIGFSFLFDYEALFKLDKVDTYMRSYDGASVLIGPIVQVFRGLLFGIILLFMKDIFVGKKYGWLRLWLVIVIVGIVNIPGAAPGSIEGMIYTQIPLQFHLKMSPEVWVQTLLFSYFVAKSPKEKNPHSFLQVNKHSFITTILAGVLFSLSGIILTFFLKADVFAGTTDSGAFVVMFVGLTIVFLTTKWYVATPSNRKLMFLALIYYIVLAIFPTIYNYIVNSPFKSMLSLVINATPVIVLVVYQRLNVKY